MLKRAVLAAMLVVPALASAATAGFVLAVRGEWRVQGGSEVLKVGAEIPPGAALVATNPDPFSAIDIVEPRSGAVVLAVRCAEAERCARPIPLPAAPTREQGALGALMEKVAARLRREPDRFVSTISRGDPEPAEAVLELAGQRVDLSPAFANLAPGDYGVRLRPLDCASGPPCGGGFTFAYTWDPRSPRAGPDVGALPGLYEIDVARAGPAGVNRPSAWVRVEPQATHAAAEASFRQVQAAMRAWPAQVDEASRKAILRAALAAMEARNEADRRGVSALERMLRDAEASDGAKSVRVANVLRDLGTAYFESRQVELGVRAFQRAIALRRELSGEGIVLADLLFKLYMISTATRDVKMMAAAAQESIAILDRAPETPIAYRIAVRMEAGRRLVGFGMPAEGEELIRQGVALGDSLGPASEAQLANRFQEAILHFREGRIEESEKISREVLAAVPATRAGWEVARDAHATLGFAQVRRQQPEAALAHFRDAERAAEKAGDALKLVQVRMTIAAMIAELTDDPAEAIRLAREALALPLARHERRTEIFAWVLASASSVMALGDDREEVRRVARMSLELNLDMFGPDHPAIAEPTASLARAAAKSGELEESARLYRRAIELVRASKVAFECECLVTYLVALADVEEKRGRAAEADALRRDAAVEALRSPHFLDHAQAAMALAKQEAAQGRRELAIFHGKRAINAMQKLRGRLSGLQSSVREAFVARREPSYRLLAGWLVDAGRLAEAQQVVDMLKQVELSEFVRTAYGPAGEGMDLLDRERRAQASLDAIGADVVRLAAQLAKVQGVDPATLSAPERAARAELESKLAAARAAVDAFIVELHSHFAGAPPERNRELGAMQLERLVAMRRTLAELGEGVVMLHYVVAPERLAIIVTTPSVQVARESRVTEAQLNRAVFELRQALQDPRADVRPAARRFHDIAIGPVADDLRQAGARTLMLSLDGALRYVPFAVLHDGERFLAERYASALFTAAARDKLKDRPRAGWTVAAMGVTQAHAGFTALPAVRQELEAIRGRLYPGEIHLDDAFTARRLQSSLERGFPLVHIASHFRFRPGTEADSFLLLGDGSRFSLRDIRTRNLDFGTVDLVTLSACETAVGGGRDASGREVEGLGALLQNQGAKGVMATLWPVADDSTARFMWTFYSSRKDALSKAEALRRAQLAFIERARGEADARLAHPYYWAPYILMGNWL